MCYNSYMKICNAKKYFFLNLLSILGYFSLCILLCWIFYFYPEIKRLDDTFIDGGMEYSIRQHISLSDVANKVLPHSLANLISEVQAQEDCMIEVALAK